MTHRATAEVDAAIQDLYLRNRGIVLTELEVQQLVAQAVTDVLECTLGRDSLVRRRAPVKRARAGAMLKLDIVACGVAQRS